VGNNGVDIPKYERIYRDYLHETREANPKIRFVLCEPFVLRCGVVTEDWIAEMTQRRAVVKKLAVEFGAIFVPFQQLFDEAVKTAPPEYWAQDGVHPSAAGHRLMAQAWLSATGEE
jgi:lysophospholipase L1-like esterase